MKAKHGFTLVEVALFLAVTGLLFVGIIGGVQGSMFQQRYNDAVQNFAEFLRSVYSQTMNVENDKDDTNTGRTDYAIYGKLITFGERYNLDNQPNTNGDAFVYTVIGDIGNDIGSTDAKASLKQLKANVTVRDKDGGRKLAGIVQQYYPRFGAKIQTTAGWKDRSYTDFVGAVLIVRHPRSGTVFTYFLKDETVQVNEKLKNVTDTVNFNPLLELIDKFEPNVDIDFCINPNGDNESQRRDIRIVAGARNASGVEIIAQDDDSAEGNRCQK